MEGLRSPWFQRWHLRRHRWERDNRHLRPDGVLRPVVEALLRHDAVLRGDRRERSLVQLRRQRDDQQQGPNQYEPAKQRGERLPREHGRDFHAHRTRLGRFVLLREWVVVDEFFVRNVVLPSQFEGGSTWGGCVAAFYGGNRLLDPCLMILMFS